jgi:hypothetical protein
MRLLRSSGKGAAGEEVAEEAEVAEAGGADVADADAAAVVSPAGAVAQAPSTVARPQASPMVIARLAVPPALLQALR